MGREVRMVPENYEHPKDENGYYIPLIYSKEELEKLETECDIPYMFEKIEPSFNMYCMYETCSEGTPLTPIFKTKEELARYCADNKISYFGRMTANYEQWMGVINGSLGGYLGINGNGFFCA